MFLSEQERRRVLRKSREYLTQNQIICPTMVDTKNVAKEIKKTEANISERDIKLEIRCFQNSDGFCLERNGLKFDIGLIQQN